MRAFAALSKFLGEQSPEEPAGNDGDAGCGTAGGVSTGVESPGGGEWRRSLRGGRLADHLIESGRVDVVRAVAFCLVWHCRAEEAPIRLDAPESQLAPDWLPEMFLGRGRNGVLDALGLAELVGYAIRLEDRWWPTRKAERALDKLVAEVVADGWESAGKEE